ncbi:hypothetical protein BDV19DRAFT_386306 [Aspergillus venezuelensis]
MEKLRRRIADFPRTLEDLQSILRVLSGFVSPEQELDLPCDQYRDLVSLQLDSCQKSCEKLDELLQKCRLDDTSPFARKHDWLRLKRALYPFKRDTLVTMSHAVSGLQDNLRLSLQLLNSALIAQQQKQIQRLMSTTTTINIQTTEVLSLIQPRQNATNSAQALASGKSAQWIPNEPTVAAIDAKHNMQQTSPAQLVAKQGTGNRSLLFPIIGQILHLQKTELERSSAFSLCLYHTSAILLIAYGTTADFLVFMMILTRGAGAMSISPTLRFYSVVPDDAPAFELLRTTDDFQSVYAAFLELFRAGKAAPTDRLVDGTTLLHAIAEMANPRRIYTSYLHPRRLGHIKELMHALIEIGAPTGEQNVLGYTAVDIMVWNNLKGCIDCPKNKGVPIIQLEMIQALLESGDCLKSLDKHADRPRGHKRNPYDSSQAMQAIRILKDKGELEDIEPARIENAIIMKCESDLEYSLATEHLSKSDVLGVLGFESLLSCCVGWIPGMKLLESSLPRDSGVTWSSFFNACWEQDYNSALLLLEYTTTVPNEFLMVAAVRKMPEVVVQTISALVKQRQELQDLAIRYLPRDVLRALALPEAGLLDTGALPVFHALVKCGIELDPSACPAEKSIYTLILRTEIADMLFEAGFTDLSQRGIYGNTPLSDLSASRADPFCGAYALMTKWMIGKGACLDQPSVGESPTIFDITERLGSVITEQRLETRGRLDTCEIAWPEANSLLPTLLCHDTRDECVCACSKFGCSPLSRLIRSYCDYHYSHSPDDFPHLDIIAEIIEDLQLPQSDEYQLLTETLRYATFEALGMSHTCHGTDFYRTKCTAKVIAEIRDEDSTSILLLDALMVEFTKKYDKGAPRMSEFIKRYWSPRMDEIVAEGDIDPEDATRIREIGVIITSRSDG